MGNRAAGGDGRKPGVRAPGGGLPDPDETAVLAPTLATTFYNCGIERQRRGQIRGAISDFSEAIRLDPGHASAWCARGFARSVLLDWRAAETDLRESCRLGLPIHRGDGVRLRIWVARARQGEREGASAELRDSVLRRGNPRPAGWILLVAGLLCDTIDEGGFLRGGVTANPQKSAEIECEARYFAAMRRLVAGEGEAAARHLAACEATGARELDVWWAAKQELASLGK